MISTYRAVFEEFGEDLKNSKVGQLDPKDPLLNAIAQNSTQVKHNFESVDNMLGDYDAKLISVLDQHEEDFLFAYKMHMVKIEKELAFLKIKAQE